MNRRDFFKIVTASSAAAATGGCQQASETILPLVVPNEQLVPGVASWFATVCRECPAGCGVIARNREGRIVKLEGNPGHPVNAGALCMRGQAALQGLLARLETFGVQVVEVRRLHDPNPPADRNLPR